MLGSKISSMDKLEKHIRQKLGKRELEPSPEAWERIASQLGTPQKTSSNRTLWWAIAAGFIALLVLSIGLFNSQDSIPEAETIVDAEAVEEDPKEDKAPFVDKMDEKVVVIEKEGMDNKITVVVEQEQLPIISIEDDEDSAVVALNPIEQEKSPEMPREISDQRISDKLKEVLAQVTALESQAIEVSDVEVDSLLRAAQKELLGDKALQQNGKIDAMALLNEVELELFDDSRNPLFIRLKEGFFKLRTAVADRNN